jgi:eukaryotic-like serine/threonine-protein kinase
MIGDTILHYKILEKLGEGGMGEVYKARDTKLDRFVALKFLPSQLTASEDDKARFIQEAKAASAMNHPNVCTIHSIEEYDKQLFIVLEFVEGKTLRDKKDSLSEKQILEIGIQIAEGLAAAHEKGIVHRDIKPENIMIRKDGIAQIMDFGLAKLYKESNVSRLTKAGTTVGTMGYMSPEQIQGLDVDHRTDIFSLGVVLYELLAGELPFKGVHETAIMYEIVNVEAPSLSTMKPVIDSELDRIILECLEKDKDERCQSAKELAKDLRKIKKSSVNRKSRIYNVDTAGIKTGTVQPQVSKTSGAFSVEVLNHRFDMTKLFKLKYIPWITTAIFLAAFIFLLRYKIVEPFGGINKFEQLTEQSGEELWPDFSHDGNYLIYTKSVDGVMHIFLQRVGGVKTIDLTSDSKYDNYQASYSPNGDLIAFRSERDGGGIFVMGSTGESVHRLTDFGYNPTWSPDGKKVLFATESILNPYGRYSISQLWTVNVSSGKTQKIYNGDAVQPVWSSNGKWIAYWGLPAGTGKRVIYILPSSGGKPIAVTSGRYIDWCPAWSPDNKYLYYSSSRGGSMNLWRIRIDENSGKKLSGFEPVTTPSPFCEMAKFSDDGRRIVYVSAEIRDNIYKLNFDPATEKIIGSPVPVTEGTKQFLYLNISQDNKWIAAASKGEQESIYIMHSDGSGIVKLTNDSYKNRGPAWSPDGRKLVFYSDRSGKYEIWEIGIDGSNLRQLTITEAQVYDPIWFPNGDKILIGYTEPAILNIRPVPTDKIEYLHIGNDTSLAFTESSLSPNGKYIAGNNQKILSGDLDGMYIYSITDKSYKKISDSGIDPLWLNDSKRILYSEKGRFYVMDTRSWISKSIYNVNQDFIATSRMYALSPDNKTIYYIKEEKESDIWMGYLK